MGSGFRWFPVFSGGPQTIRRHVDVRMRGRLTPEQLRGEFKLALRIARTTGVVYPDNGLDKVVEDAIGEVAMGCPDPAPELIAAAEHAFAGMLDGSNAARARQDLLDWFDSHS
ncbi:hypothetical protein [Nocardia cerradoensis]|uniref:hypothetical protein n=1 Tax=Nocardia cerradoensis TaxID=85688 RepID=UPI0012F6BCC1|nr:hypothetical protein [Nocardia cerradoensis]NKY46171.1 hypothetical protein [Nocardia cerradoensis]